MHDVALVGRVLAGIVRRVADLVDQRGVVVVDLAAD
jgi:hypothetical protein